MTKHFVFLQGMPSPFFPRIAQALRQQGHRASAIHFCAGDWLLWQGTGGVHYRGRYADWPAYFANYCRAHNVSDLVLLGEQRRYHKEAVVAAQQAGVRVTVTDFGYLRPDWITLEPDGMSGNSKFPKNADAIRRIAESCPPLDKTARFSDDFWVMARGDLVYSFANVLLKGLYPFYRRSDNRSHPLLYFPAMGLRLSRMKPRNSKAEGCMALLRARKVRYFLFPLQLEHDFQIVAYSPFSGIDEPLQKVIASFAQHAPRDTHLVIKVHPWDPGFKSWCRRTARYATQYGVSERVVCIDGCTLDDTLQGALGMVTVNSTSGIRALELGYPVKTLGQAIYEIDGLTHQGTLDSFWSGPAQPNTGLVDAFMRALAGTSQIRGVFFDEPGLTAAVEAATARLA